MTGRTKSGEGSSIRRLKPDRLSLLQPQHIRWPRIALGWLLFAIGYLVRDLPNVFHTQYGPLPSELLYDATLWACTYLSPVIFIAGFAMVAPLHPAWRTMCILIIFGVVVGELYERLATDTQYFLLLLIFVSRYHRESYLGLFILWMLARFMRSEAAILGYRRAGLVLWPVFGLFIATRLFGLLDDTISVLGGGSYMYFAGVYLGEPYRIVCYGVTMATVAVLLVHARTLWQAAQRETTLHPASSPVESLR